MKVAIIMGSNSDWPVLEPAEKTLKSFGVEVEVVVASAHRTPEMVHEFAAGARERSHVLEAMHVPSGADVRFSLGTDNDETQIRQTVDTLYRILNG